MSSAVFLPVLCLARESLIRLMEMYNRCVRYIRLRRAAYLSDGSSLWFSASMQPALALAHSKSP
ncbi:hypothetical protein BO82DRAFT_187086 [Aspergillus uvarum CBS 121591]|uniref:Uncharacterized protein n=1 Tax=Aspergillus uvarum CBS 121591 TaxID=1448315 RepID=A0A319DB35_9EURO|nr:hypothetical protein BO82DRAFT_187086 [Aspergillus uvarum CBS 121591]PYH77182.1 hypothetical protein BO82DRAFT_187086 [Aspergillus uvarum CBS 121591]